MKWIKRILGAVALLAAAFVGVIYIKHQLVMRQFDAEISSLAHKRKPTPWRYTEHRDELTDKVSRTAKSESSEGASIEVTCTAGDLAITVGGAHFRQGDGRFYVNYRFDKQPAVEIQLWPSGVPWVKVPQAEVESFLRNMRASQALLMDVDSSEMEIQRHHFSMAGLEDELPKVLSDCRRPVPKAETAG